MNVNQSMTAGATSSHSRPERPQLNDEQSQLIADTLSGFDAEQLSQEDAQAIINVFSEAGIKPSKALAYAMSEAGFDAKAVGELAGLEKPPGPPPRQSSSDGSLSEMVDHIADMLSQLNVDDAGSGTLTEQQKSELYKSVIEKFGGSGNGSLISLTA